MKALVTGGVRSGKSFHAESLVVAHERVVYVAPGPAADPDEDPEWAQRVARHQERRPSHWTTVETTELVGAIEGGDADADTAVLIDCLGTWLTSQIDELDGWDAIREEWEQVLLDRVDAAVEALARTQRTVVLVTNEVGLGVVPEHRSGRIFRDLLGVVNQRFAAECDEVLLVVAGRVITL
ncbi:MULTISPECIES: bifunctional adenosylcobinamide kinase/adenosylcobinamide-phosphate guanylyltransferase [unclassified Aeromicrobium]|jgi:adenosylcobinamide kinase/adenosylcobinamide-phosphate guanylyltransferase|uniref:bifunctional adenosylcobinamide kinase/adenosylcobinamide-phosphate guanylyltransferase n=1 Tax=unclassified Aeromicrobium TaxID=2633570 RepID=UPI0006F24C82|nr:MULTISPECIES: bifunctional adenosylcobinamide kinase/adenosylcobinamide-phosphate guanylyltransferase [unclassified Aeromicrobium]KQO42754.1 adenosylcobinamide kinase/adenosylcobinamide phosphate guanyltransferase [Aeromicrobium sp. Leaf245]KQP26747.1 adenosylcobinamide kinase/adenosylcobinamide phosphate guanyltransferase [Aeromicrobium sp. Leaf272]KQP77863.1 adenosylcobinamide kinase/adenosylcobinamide phosphate guanyltransferase [Aeromicrobium sp. Leaf289]KQP83500.1 adenosylcobinamide kin